MSTKNLSSDTEKLKKIFNKYQKKDNSKALEEMNKKLDSVQKRAETVRDSLIKRHKDKILGTILIYKKTTEPVVFFCSP